MEGLLYSFIYWLSGYYGILLYLFSPVSILSILSTLYSVIISFSLSLILYSVYILYSISIILHISPFASFLFRPFSISSLSLSLSILIYFYFLFLSTLYSSISFFIPVPHPILGSLLDFRSRPTPLQLPTFSLLSLSLSSFDFLSFIKFSSCLLFYPSSTSLLSFP